MKKAILIILATLFAVAANARVVELNSRAQANKEINKPGPVVVMYYTDWCGACKRFAPIFEEASDLIMGTRFYKINADKFTLYEHRISYIPTILTARNAKQLRTAPCQIQPRLDPRKVVLEIVNCQKVSK